MGKAWWLNYNVQIDENEITVIENENIKVRVRIDDVIQIDAYKIDLFTTDLICLDILTKELFIMINEDQKNWDENINKLEIKLGKIMVNNWYKEIMLPAFKENRTTIWKKNNSHS